MSGVFGWKGVTIEGGTARFLSVLLFFYGACGLRQECCKFNAFIQLGVVFAELFFFAFVFLYLQDLDFGMMVHVVTICAIFFGYLIMRPECLKRSKSE
jgi:hypothetical protein